MDIREEFIFILMLMLTESSATVQAVRGIPSVWWMLRPIIENTRKHEVMLISESIYLRRKVNLWKGEALVLIV